MSSDRLHLHLCQFIFLATAQTICKQPIVGHRHSVILKVEAFFTNPLKAANPCLMSFGDSKLFNADKFEGGAATFELF